MGGTSPVSPSARSSSRAIWPDIAPSGMVSRRCTGRAARSTSSAPRTDTPAGKRNSPARSGPSARVRSAARPSRRGSPTTPLAASAAAISSAPPRGTTMAVASASGPGPRSALQSRYAPPPAARSRASATARTARRSMRGPAYRNSPKPRKLGRWKRSADRSASRRGGRLPRGRVRVHPHLDAARLECLEARRRAAIGDADAAGGHAVLDQRVGHLARAELRE